MWRGIWSFESWDELEAALAERAEVARQAAERSTPSQHSAQFYLHIDYWKRDRFLIVGEVLEEEAAYDAETREWRRLHGWRLVRAYSEVVPPPVGELGDEHVSNFVPLSEAQFRDLYEKLTILHNSTDELTDILEFCPTCYFPLALGKCPFCPLKEEQAKMKGGS